MKENIQEKLLTDLYTLRAGMSAVAILSELITQKKEMKNLELTYSTDTVNNLSNQSPSFRASKKYYINGNLNNISIYNDSLFNNVKNCLEEKRTSRKTKKYFAGYIAGLSVSLIFLIACIVLTAVFSFQLPATNVIVICSICGIILFLLSGCYCLETLIKVYSDKKKTNAYISNYQNFVNEYPQFCDNIAKYSLENEKKINKLLEDRIKLLEVLQSKFGHLLNYNDWKYLDFVIYKVDDLKIDEVSKVASLIDNKVKINCIQEDIRKATTQIFEKINSNFELLSKNIDNNFAIITKNVGIFNINMVLSNALMQKSNETSIQLFETIEKFNY